MNAPLVSKDKISVIIPVFNMQEHLTRCIDSVISQSYKNLEIILVDDGSTDNSASICDSYKSLDKRIKVIHKANGGLSSARNEGLEVATGELIAFVDSDDWLEFDMLEYLINILYKYNSDIAECDAFREVYDERINKSQPNKEHINLLSREQALLMIIKTSKTGVWKRLYRSFLFQDIRFPDGMINEDFIVSYQVFAKSKKIAVSNQKKYYYYQGGQSITRSGLKYQDFDYLLVCEKILKLTMTENKKIQRNMKHRRYRANFTLLAKLAYYGVQGEIHDIKERTDELVCELRRNYLALMVSPIIQINRKIMITIVCINYNLFKFLVKHLK